MRFLCDAMLGKLARWLRIIGYDTELATNEGDSSLEARARLEGRILLTLDKSVKGLHLPSQNLDDQLVFLARELGMEIPSEPIPLRCPKCNGELEPTSVGLPNYVDKGWKCKRCGQLYWEGSHWMRMRSFLKRVRDKISSQPT